jgi:hypothetical protein
MRNRIRYVPLIEIKTGMVLGAPIRFAHKGNMAFSLPAAHTLTDDNLNQLVAHRVEFVSIAEPDTRTDDEVAVEAALAARRVMHIFSGADLTEPTMAAFFDQVLIYRST